MTPDTVLFRDIAYVFLAALLGGLAAHKLRLPLILGYVVGGILISPFTPGPSISDVHNFKLFAEVGVVLLMFSIGMEFSMEDLFRVKWVALAGAPLGILLSVGLGVLAARLAGWGTVYGVVLGAVASVASTMVLARLLMDRNELTSPHGQVMIGITLVEDVAVVILTVLLPTLSGAEPASLSKSAWALAKAILLLIPLGFLAAKVIPRLLTRIAATRNQELLVLVALAICLGTAVLTKSIGLSLALGAFLAGLTISGSTHAHATLARMLPLRDAFVALFFVTIGALINPALLLDNLSLLLVLLLLVVPAKLLVWTAVVRLFGYPPRTALAVALGLTQIGEFSFVLVQVALHSGLVGEEVYSATLAASLLSIPLNVLLVRFLLDPLVHSLTQHPLLP
jgi:CPA2 family monovalent cation:H+ antiporter-2